jgi:preprotein translocase subunit SecF
MNKKQLHHLWTKLRKIKVWYLLVPFVLATAVAVFALRQNNLGMVSLRQAVYQADQQNKDVEGALQRLRAYVYAHMNTNLATGSDSVYPPIQLKYTYQRLQDAEKTRVQQESTSVYSQAQAYCEQQNSTDFSGRNRVPCIEKYVSEHTAKPRAIPDAMYKFDFVSPSWSPDLAGFAVAIAVLLLILLILRVALGAFLRAVTK